ncbi:unnamed protein product [Ectocarpus sp. 6 AP-2014]
MRLFQLRRRTKSSKIIADVNISAFPLVTIDLALRVVGANKAFRDNVSPSNILPVGGVLASILKEDSDRCKLVNALSAAAVSLDIQVVTVSKKSNMFPIVKSMIAHLSRHDDDEHVTLTLTPISHPKPSTDIEASDLIDFFDEAPIALHWLGGDGKVIWANKRELEVLGYTREEYIGQEITKFCPDSSETVLDIFKELGSGNTIRDVPVRFRTKSGQIRDLLIDSNVNFKSDGSFNHTRCFIRDDTFRKVTEARVAAAQESGRKVTQQKEKFVSRILHEMKTPVHIMQMSQMSERSSSIVTSQSALLGRTLRNVSTAIRFDEGNVVASKPERVHLDSFVKGVLSQIHNETLDADIVYVGIEDFGCSQFDSNTVRLALEEVVLNSVMRSRGNKVTARVTYDPKTNFLKFSVEDTGDYIDDENVHDIFQNYWKCAVELPEVGGEFEDCSTRSDLSSNSNSMGVGMNVAFNYVQCVGSTLKVDSSPHRTCFVFDIFSERMSCDDSCESIVVSEETTRNPESWRPVASSDVSGIHIVQPLEPTVPRRGLGLRESSGRHVLVVDDNTICQKVCKRLLEKMGHTCEVASNGAIAANMVATSSFDIVFMDLRMPVMDGIDSASSIRSDLHSEVPIIAFSAESDEDVKAAAKEAGMNDFVEKPATSSILEEVINRYCY